MRFTSVVSRFAILAMLGCQPATRYTPQSEAPADKAAESATNSSDFATVPPELMWQDDQRQAPTNVMPILFVHAEKDRAGWDKQQSYWRQTTGTQAEVAAVLGMSTGLIPFPLSGPLVVGPDPMVVKIKVPRGLDDPTPFVPASNPLTYPKWELGRDLFYDAEWLTAKGNTSCASCHMPDRGFTDGMKVHNGFNTPTLVNLVYGTSFFWDGRAGSLEEVFARNLEDERETANLAATRHTWGGSVLRLMNGKYKRRFENVFATPPTQDAVGKALATYMRTLLAGASLHDLALIEQAGRKSKELEADDYEKVLDARALKLLGREGAAKKEVAEEVFTGYRLFHNLQGERKLNCVNCHAGRLFTDSKFHNVGVGDREKMVVSPFPGRFASLPIGQKDRTLIGAYKTPTLRGLLRTAPYFHDGEQQTLEAALAFHTQSFRWNIFLAPEMVVEGNRSSPRYLDLTPTETKALLAFLSALNGSEVDEAVLRR